MAEHTEVLQQSGMDRWTMEQGQNTISDKANLEAACRDLIVSHSSDQPLTPWIWIHTVSFVLPLSMTDHSIQLFLRRSITMDPVQWPSRFISP